MTAQPEVVWVRTSKFHDSELCGECDSGNPVAYVKQASLTAALAERDVAVSIGMDLREERNEARSERDKLAKELATSVELMRRARKEVFGPFAVLVPGLAAEIDAFLTAQAAQGEKG